MKAKRRHDLKSNELFQSLENAREFVRTRGNHLLGVAVAVIVVAGLAAYWQHVSAQSRAVEWQTYYDLRSKSWDADPELGHRVSQLAKQTGDRILARAALQYVAQIAWEQATKTAKVDDAKLDEAKAANEKIIQQYGADDDAANAVGIAHRGLAAIAETRRNADEARTHYKAIVDDPRLEASPVRTVAETQLAELDERMVPVTLVNPPPAPPKSPTTTRPARKVTTRPTARGRATTQPAQAK